MLVMLAVDVVEVAGVILVVVMGMVVSSVLFADHCFVVPLSDFAVFAPAGSKRWTSSWKKSAGTSEIRPTPT